MRAYARYSPTPAPMTRGLPDGAGAWKKSPSRTQERAAAMRMASPAFIPRNHVVEAALDAASASAGLSAVRGIAGRRVAPIRGQAWPGALRHASPSRGMRASNFLRHLNGGEVGGGLRTSLWNYPPPELPVGPRGGGVRLLKRCVLLLRLGHHCQSGISVLPLCKETLIRCLGVGLVPGHRIGPSQSQQR